MLISQLGCLARCFGRSESRRMRLNPNNAKRILALSAPFTPLSASLSSFAWIGWLATAVALLAAIASWFLDGCRQDSTRR
jgi:hypothetical protein